MTIPFKGYTSKFHANITQYFGEDGERWVQALPGLITAAAVEWRLTNIIPYQLSINYVAAATLPNGQPVVLKLLAPGDEAAYEVSALQAFSGRACVKLIKTSADGHAMLLEQCQPGIQLASLRSDRARTRIAAQVFGRLQQPVPVGNNHIPLQRWFDGVLKKQTQLEGYLPPALLPAANQEATSVLPGLFASTLGERLIHGDLHHFNILKNMEEWLAIDPKGVIGPMEYECGPYLLNPWPNLLKATNPAATTMDRVAIFSEMLGFDRKAVRAWGLCHSVMSFWWDHNPKTGKGGEYSAAVANMIYSIKE